jgi:hypothetical protein
VRLGTAQGHGAGRAPPLSGVGCRRAGPRDRDGQGQGRGALGLGCWARSACCAWAVGKAGWGALVAWAGQGKSRAGTGGKEGRWAVGAGPARGFGVYFLFFLFLSLFSI